MRVPLHPGQAAVHADPHRFRVVVAGRRWGKTRLALTTLLRWGLRPVAPPRPFWYVAPDRVMAKDILWQPLKAALDPSWLAGPAMETELSVPLITGHSLRLMGADDEDKLRGRGLGGVVVDEYADMAAVTWTEALRPALADFKAPALIIGTPKSFNHFYDLFVLGQSPHPRWKSWQFRSLDNPWLDPQEIADARAELDARTFRQEWEASFETLTGRAYYAFHRQHHVGPVTLERGAPVVVSFDFNVNPACAVLGQRLGDDVRAWREVRIQHAGGEATRAVALAARELLVRAGWTGPLAVYGDPAGRAQKTTGPSDHAVLKTVFPMAAWRIRTSPAHVRDRIAAVNGRLETLDGRRHTRIDPACVHLIADLEQVTLKDTGELDKASNPLLTHLSDAWGYFVEYEFATSRAVVTAIHASRH